MRKSLAVLLAVCICFAASPSFSETQHSALLSLIRIRVRKATGLLHQRLFRQSRGRPSPQKTTLSTSPAVMPAKLFRMLSTKPTPKAAEESSKFRADTLSFSYREEARCFSFLFANILFLQ